MYYHSYHLLQYRINYAIHHICGMCVSSTISFSALSELIMRKTQWRTVASLRWRHNGRDGVSNYKPHDCLLNRLFRHRSKRTPKLCFTGLCAGNSPVTSEFPAQMASNAKNVSISWRHHVMTRKAFWITGPLWREFTSDRWIYSQRDSDAGICMFSMILSKEAVEQAVVSSVIWEHLNFMWQSDKMTTNEKKTCLKKWSNSASHAVRHAWAIAPRIK